MQHIRLINNQDLTWNQYTKLASLVKLEFLPYMTKGRRRLELFLATVRLHQFVIGKNSEDDHQLTMAKLALLFWLPWLPKVLGHLNFLLYNYLYFDKKIYQSLAKIAAGN